MKINAKYLLLKNNLSIVFDNISKIKSLHSMTVSLSKAEHIKEEKKKKKHIKGKIPKL